MLSHEFEDLVDSIADLPFFTRGNAEKLAFNLFRNQEENLKLLQNIYLHLSRLKLDQETKQIIPINQIANANQSKERLLLFWNQREAERVLTKIKSNYAFFIIDLDPKKDLTQVKKLNTFIARLNPYLKKYQFKKLFLFSAPSYGSELLGKVIEKNLRTNFKNENIILDKPKLGLPFEVSLDYLDQKTLQEVFKKYE